MADCGYNVGDILRFVHPPVPHFAVYIGNGEIVHYQKAHNMKASIQLETLNGYKQKCKFNISTGVVKYKFPGRRYSGDEIRERALSKLGQGDYNLAANNCEHFATWCVYGKEVSECASTVVGASIGGTTVTAGGGVAGAVVGAAIGSIVPVAGTFVGGVAGAAIGTGIGMVVGTIGGGTTGVIVNRVKQYFN